MNAKLNDEAGRVAALRRYEILDTPREASFDRITGLVKAVLGVPIVAISLVDTDRQWFKSCIGLATEQTAREISFCRHTIEGTVPLYVPEARLDPRFAENVLVTGAPFVVSYLGIPLATPDGYNLGALCAMDTKPRTYNAEQIEVLKSFAALVLDEMELRQLAQIDYLTGVATRRGFCMEADKAISLYERHGRSSALVVLDIDYFKRVNDTYGHPAGDEVLRAVGAKLTSLLRSSDVVGRLGGEEFGVILGDADHSEAMGAAERFREGVEALVIENKPPIRVTASFGIAMLGADSCSAEQWIARADTGLYEAKRTGRNRCCAVPEAAGVLLSR